MDGDGSTIERWVVAACATASFVAPALASAEPNTASLAYERKGDARECPDRQALRDGVAARLGYDPFRDESDRHVRVVVRSAEQTRYRARIEIASPDRPKPGVRELTSDDPSCDDLARALVFTVSIAIDPGSASGGGRPGAKRRALMAAVLRSHDAQAAADRAQLAAEPEPEEDGSPPSPPDDSTTTPAPAPNPLGFRAGLGGGLAVGTAPKATGLVRLTAELGRDRWSIRLAGRTELPVRGSIDTGQFETSLSLAELAVCGDVDVAFGCAVGAAGGVRLTGVDLAESQSGVQSYAAAGARLGVDLPLSHLFVLRFQGQFLATLVRTQVLVDSESVWTTPDVSGSLGTLLIVDF